MARTCVTAEKKAGMQIVKSPGDGLPGAYVVGLVAYDPSRDVYCLLESEARSGRSRWLRRHDGQLSLRELQVLHLVALGCSNEEVARKLRISLNTTKRHLQSIFFRLGAASRSEAVSKALRDGWLRFA